MLLIASQCRFELEYLFGDHHLELVDLGQIGESRRILFTVENLFPIQVDLQAALTGGGEPYGYVPGILVAVKLRRHPRGDREVPSRHAKRDFNIYFAVLGSWHIPPGRGVPYIGSLTNREDECNLLALCLPARTTTHNNRERTVARMEADIAPINASCQ